MATETCPTRLVDDSPADADAFGAHQRIADTIAQLVEDTRGGKTIGLSGSWGAGKSTIVRMLAHRYQANQERTLWSLDAWAHEGDPLRRTFLERLIAALAYKGWLDAQAWSTDLEILSKRRKISEKRQAPQLTVTGVLIAASVLLVPIGTAVVSNQLRIGLTLDPSRPFDRVAVLGLSLVLAPLLALAGALLLALASKPNTDVRGRLRDALTVFAQRSETHARTETLDSPEPNSLEFETLFDKVMTAALALKQRRLVIVIDNLDRVGTTQALAVWSTLQTFMQQRAVPAPWIEQVWCLLPFDAPAIRRLWQQNGASAAVAESFLDKTFQLRFEVPPPQLSNWKDYLMARLKEALPAHSDEDFFRVYRLYAVRRSKQWSAPTPRELKLFVNQVGSLHLQWQHTIPLEDLGYYVALQRADVDIPAALLKGELPAAGEAGLVSQAMRHNIAAVAYGVPPDQSHELLLRQPILEALEIGDATRLAILSDASDRFWLVLESCVSQASQEWPTAEGGKLLHAVAAVDPISVGTAGDVSWRLQVMVRSLLDAVEDARTWDPMDATAVNGILALSRRGHWATHLPDDRGIARRLFRYFLQVRLTQATSFSTEHIAPFIDDYLRLTQGLGTVVPDQYLEVVPGEPAVFLETARVLVARDIEGLHWRHFAPTRVDGVRAVLVGRVSQDFGATESAAVKVIAAVGDIDWSAFLDAAANRLKGAGAKSGDGYLLSALHSLYSRADTATLLHELVEQEVAYVKLGEVSTAPAPGSSTALQTTLHPDPLVAAAWLYTIMRVDPSLRALQLGEWQTFMDGPHTQTLIDVRERLFRADESLVSDLARVVIEMGDASALFEVAEHCQQTRFTMLSVLHLLADAPPRVFPPALLVERWDTSFPGYARYDLARDMRAKRPALGDVVERSAFVPGLAGLYAGVLDANQSQHEPFMESCRIGVETATGADWDASFTSDIGLGMLVAALARRGQQVRLGRDAAEAARTLVRNVEAWNVTQRDATWVEAFLRALAPDQREAIVEAIFAQFDASATAREPLVTATLTVLLDAQRLQRRPKTSFLLARHLLLYDDERLAALASLLMSAPGLVRTLDRGDRARLRSLVDERLAKPTSEGARAALTAIVTAFDAPAPAAGPAAQAGPATQVETT